MSKKNGTCFGFFGGSSKLACERCVAARRCKAILVSDGFDLVAELLEQLVAELPANAVFVDSDRAAVLVDQLLKPTESLPPEVEDLVGLVNQVQPDSLDLGNL